MIIGLFAAILLVVLAIVIFGCMATLAKSHPRKVLWFSLGEIAIIMGAIKTFNGIEENFEVNQSIIFTHSLFFVVISLAYTYAIWLTKTK